MDYLYERFNNCFKKGIFPNNFKKDVVHPAHKKDCKTEKSNGWPIRTLSNLSKFQERFLYDQMYTYFGNFFPQCGFRKRYSAQNCLLAMTKKWRKPEKKNKGCSAVFTDLTKAFHCLLHDILIAKLPAFGFGFKSLRVIQEHLNDRIQVTKVSSFYSVKRFFYLRCPTRFQLRASIF